MLGTRNSAFYAEDDTRGFDPVVSDLIATLGRHGIPLWRIKASLRSTLNFYLAGEALELRFSPEQFMPMNEDRN
jgi:hypothetical protein